jgi:hypothetical protein
MHGGTLNKKHMLFHRNPNKKGLSAFSGKSKGNVLLGLKKELEWSSNSLFAIKFRLLLS